MICRSLSGSDARLTFQQALFSGMGSDRALYLPESWPRFSPPEMDELLALDFPDRCVRLTRRLLGDEYGDPACERIARGAFTFPVPLVELDPGIFALELFHGPTLAFKDFGARFMARCMAEAGGARPAGSITVLCATSGDTGAAAAHAFHGVPGIRVVVLYPEGRISPLQEGQMVTLGGNVLALSVKGSFDDCQRLVRGAFEDRELRERAGLTTANSINLGRLVPQSFYYFEAVAALRARGIRQTAVFSVPSGNFGNLAAGISAWRMGLPVESFLAATNANDVVPRFLESGKWDPHATVATCSNAMDVGDPGNWPRVRALLEGAPPGRLRARSVSDAETLRTIGEVEKRAGYLLDPHGAVAYRVLTDFKEAAAPGVFLATAHPAKFNEVMRLALGREVDMPPELEDCLERPRHGAGLEGSASALRKVLIAT